MATLHLHPAAPMPLGLIAQAIPRLTRHELADLTERLIDRLDEIDGDEDVEANGDELDGSMGEDDFCPQGQNWLGYPGCPISDPGEDDDADEEDDPSGQCDEDGINTGSYLYGMKQDGPGCQISDPGDSEDDCPERD